MSENDLNALNISEFTVECLPLIHANVEKTIHSVEWWEKMFILYFSPLRYSAWFVGDFIHSVYLLGALFWHYVQVE